MSMQIIQQVLCRAAVDRAFQEALLDAPGTVLGQFDLDEAEFAMLVANPSHSLVDLAAAAEAWRRGEPVASRQYGLALAS